ncbi:MAG: tol-pal system protein YbgF, partial [Deltaproteobacteria bacterium RBG_13_47_9]
SREMERTREEINSRMKTMEEIQKASEEKTRAQEDRTKAIETRVKALEDQIKMLGGKIDQLGVKQVESEKMPGREGSIDLRGLSTGAGDLYKDAYETFQKGDLDGARRKFETFLKQYPNTELSDNAQFWMGETYYQKKDYEKAILEYEKAIAKYPEGDKIPAALFKQALAFLELGDKSSAKN